MSAFGVSPAQGAEPTFGPGRAANAPSRPLAYLVEELPPRGIRVTREDIARFTAIARRRGYLTRGGERRPGGERGPAYVHPAQLA